MNRLLAVLLAGTVLTGCDSAEEREAKACKDSRMAFVMSQNFVKQRLKSPSTAKFPYLSDRGVVSYLAGNPSECKHTVIAYFDAQNSFGATVRGTYIVEMQKLPNKDVWRANNLQINQ